MKRKTYIEGWKIYPWQCGSHHGQGAIAATLILLAPLPWMVLALVWAAYYVAYQALTRWRKGDSAGLDVCDWMMGMAAAAIPLGMVQAL